VVFLYKFSYYYSLLSSGFKPLKIEANQWFLIKNTGGIRYLYPSLQQDDYNNLNIPFTGNLFIGFKEALGYRESENKYKTVNSLGYLGKYQFGNATLKSVGIYDSSLFLRSPKIRESLCSPKNKWILQDIIKNTMVRWLVVS
jgi:hypothetical protein